MAWSLRNVGNVVSRSDLGSLTVGVPSGTQAGDLLVMVGYHVDRGLFALPSTSSWVERFTYSYSSSSTDTVQVWTKLAGSSEGSVTLSVADWSTPATYDCAAYMIAFDGIASAVPDGTPVAGGPFPGNVYYFPQTTTVSNDLVLMLAMQADPLALWSAGSAANLSSVTERLDSRIISGASVFNVQTENSSFELDFWNQNGWTYGYSGINGTPTWTRTATNAANGTYAGRLQYTANALDTAGSINLYGMLSGVGTISPGEVQSVGFNLRGVNTGCSVRTGVRWYDASGNFITYQTAAHTINNTAMDRYTMTSNGAPSTPTPASQCMITLRVSEIANGDSIDLYFDCAQLEYGATANAYGGSGGSGLSLAAYTATMATAGSTGSPSLASDGDDGVSRVGGILTFKPEADAPPPDTDPDVKGVFAFTDARKVAPPQAYTGGSWHSCGVLVYTSGRWVPVIDAAVVPPPPADTFNAMTDGLLANRCHNDGTQDDKAHLDAQAADALAAGSALYLPGGTGYKLNSQWTPPAGLLVVGDGPSTSKLLGIVGWRSNTEFRNLRIGAYTDSAATPYDTSLYENIVFRGCRLRGGVYPVVDLPGGHGRVRNLSFIDTEFEVPHTGWSAGGSAHCLSLMGDSSAGSIIDKITISRCHFGVPNDYNETMSMYGNCIFYTHNLGGSGYLNDVNITDSIFELSYNWGIDFAGYNTDEREWPSDYPYNTAYIARNEFRGCGKIKDSSNLPEYPWILDIEPLCGGIIEDNVFWPSAASPIRTTWNTANMIVRNNVFDYRQNSGVVPYMPGVTWNNGDESGDYMRGRQIQFADGGGNVAYGNRLYLPAQYAGEQTANGWIWIKDGSTFGGKTCARSTAYDNSVFFGGDPGDIGE